MMIQDVLLQPGNAPNSADEEHMQDVVEALEKLPKEKRAVLVTKKAEAVARAREPE